MSAMTIAFGAVLLALSPEYFRLRLYEYAIPLVVLGTALIAIGMWRIFH